MIIFSGLLIVFSFAMPVESLEIDSKVYFRGENLGSPRVTVAPGQKAQFTLATGSYGPQFTLELTPGLENDSTLRFHYNLELKENKHTTISRGQLKLIPGEKGQIRLDDGPIVVELKVRSAAKLVRDSETR